MDKAVKQYLSKIGQKGGKAGRGNSKRRSAEFYKEISRKGVEARRKAKKEG